MNICRYNCHLYDLAACWIQLQHLPLPSLLDVPEDARVVCKHSSPTQPHETPCCTYEVVPAAQLMLRYTSQQSLAVGKHIVCQAGITREYGEHTRVGEDAKQRLWRAVIYGLHDAY